VICLKDNVYFALSDSGKTYCWGNDRFQQGLLASSYNYFIKTPCLNKVMSSKKIIEINTGEKHCYALDSKL
jgi:alpha-tubulin suppressor-like RCC1 family protein